jgi:hypothetical protein
MIQQTRFKANARAWISGGLTLMAALSAGCENPSRDTMPDDGGKRVQDVRQDSGGIAPSTHRSTAPNDQDLSALEALVKAKLNSAHWEQLDLNEGMRLHYHAMSSVLSERYFGDDVGRMALVELLNSSSPNAFHDDCILVTIDMLANRGYWRPLEHLLSSQCPRYLANIGSTECIDSIAFRSGDPIKCVEVIIEAYCHSQAEAARSNLFKAIERMFSSQLGDAGDPNEFVNEAKIWLSAHKREARIECNSRWEDHDGAQVLVRFSSLEIGPEPAPQDNDAPAPKDSSASAPDAT